jgi:parallel beta-helix repeat protein
MKTISLFLVLLITCTIARAQVSDSIKILSYTYNRDTLNFDVSYSGENLSTIKTFLFTSNWGKKLASDSLKISNGSDTISFTLVPIETLASGQNYNLSVDLFSPEGVKLKNHIITVTYTKVVTITHTAYYVSAEEGNDGFDGKSPEKAFKTLQKAANSSNPGDTLLVMNGNYESNGQTLLTISTSGLKDNWITYKAYPGHQPKLKIAGSVWNAVIIDANYIVFEGFELEGNNQNLTLADAEAAETEAENGGTDWYNYGNYNTNALTLGGNNSKGSHHIVVRNCLIHDFPGSGIASIRTDYVTIENCILFNNAWYTMYAGSGISLYHSWNSDNSTGYKNYIRDNICHDNKTLVKWVGTGSYSDGNGIIIDDNKNKQSGALGGAYTGRTLVENNICFNNGGSGIHAYSSSHVDIINNTAYNNGIVPQVAYPEIYQNTCTDGKVMNNIMYARTGGKVNDNYNNNGIVYDYNIYFNGAVAIKGKNDLVADPLFVNASVDPATADFHVKDGSPAIDFGTSELFASKDISGETRPKGSRVDAGAYESAYTVGINSSLNSTEFSIWPNPATSTLQISYPTNNATGKIQLFNELGIKVLENFNVAQQQPIVVSALQPGIYFIKVNANQKTVVKSFIKK